MTKKIIGIWAEDEQGLIGREGTLPWCLPKELQHFKETTQGHALLMGRVTFDGMNRRILPGRQTLILSSDLSIANEKVTVFSGVEQVLDWFDKQDNHLFIVGGARVYKSFEPYYDTIVKTKVHGYFDGDTYFPDLDWTQFELIDSQLFTEDEQNAYAFTVYQFERRNKE